ncbi:hypothetical protein BJV78DRAFT_436283 [Lactifluus subvellereus]|nr:hypothetical protein BJV78DRAFT_436283 [Lactifluus subvellereus]
MPHMCIRAPLARYPLVPDWSLTQKHRFLSRAVKARSESERCARRTATSEQRIPRRNISAKVQNTVTVPRWRAGPARDGPLICLNGQLAITSGHTMTRYTNIGRKRTYIQASFDPKNDQVTTTNAASTSAPGTPGTSQTHHEGSVDTPVKSSSRKRRRKSKGDSEETTAAESTPAIAANDGEKNKSMAKSEKTRKALARLKAKERAKRDKCALIINFGDFVDLH